MLLKGILLSHHPVKSPTVVTKIARDTIKLYTEISTQHEKNTQLKAAKKLLKAYNDG